MGLNKKDRDTLIRTHELQSRHGADGIFANGGGHMSHLRKLERWGLLRYVGTGADIDGDREDVRIFELTDAGRSEVQAPTDDRSDS